MEKSVIWMDFLFFEGTYRPIADVIPLFFLSVWQRSLLLSIIKLDNL
jgi:hypothetical protein